VQPRVGANETRFLTRDMEVRVGTYVLRRLLQMIPVFLGATFLIFYLVLGMPGDPLASMCGERGCDPATAASLRAQFHIGEPLHIQYFEYMKGIVTLDFGETFSRRPVMEVMRDAFPITIRLATVAFLIEIFVGIPLGLLAGLRRGKFIDGTVLLGTLLVISIPIFVVGFLLQYFMGIKLGWFSPTVSGEAPWNELLLPGIVLASISMAYIMRLTRTSVVENLHADYVRTAIAKGLPRWRVVTVHLLRNSMIPVVTYLGVDIGALLAGAIVTERIFNIHGVGGTLYQAILRGEAATIVSLVTIIVIVFLVANLLVDLLYAVLDPRIRLA
jgi:oligopeptide transport system permease protein